MLLHNNIHNDIADRLEHFIKLKKIPNIIFHGNSGCGKNTILSNFLGKIYQENQAVMKNYTMTVNCAHGRGIRFIREDLKFFAKTNVDLMDGELFKSIVLLNADKLTIDAQSALRRCIELFCHSTRFFIVVDDKNKLLKPILSRFCDIYIPDDTVVASNNLHRHKLDQTLGLNAIKQARSAKLKALLNADYANPMTTTATATATATVAAASLIRLAEDLYEMSYSALDLIALIESEPEQEQEQEQEQEPEPGSSDTTYTHDTKVKKYELLIAFSRVKKEIRNEKLLMLFILYFMKFRSELELKNITFI
jgi:DNA polymerase III delta prime subunit